MEAEWLIVDKLVSWLDDNKVPEVFRILKVSEETGELSQAYINCLGMNPRKTDGTSFYKVESELCDVIITAMVALASVSPEPKVSLQQNFNRIINRIRQ